MGDIPNCIHDQFIEAWHPRYDEIEDDEPEYRRLVNQVRLEMGTGRSLTRQTFTEILNWKSARVKGRIDWSAFEIYTSAITTSQETSGMARMQLLVDLPGIGAPVASTFLQFIYPSSPYLDSVRSIDFALAQQYLSGLGKAIDIFSRPDRIVVGVRTAHTRRILEKLLS